MGLIWVWLAIGALLVFWIVWPADGHRLPILLLVRNRADEIEGVLRIVASGDREVHVIVLESGDETWTIVTRFAREARSVRASRANLESGLDATGLSAAILVRLDDGRPALGALRQAGF